MSIDSEATTDDTADVETLAHELGDAIAGMPEYERFLDAQRAVKEDDQVQQQIAEFEQQREAYLQARERGEATNEDLRALQDEQEELHDMPTMSEFLEAQNDLELRLQALNAHISDPLDIDFGEKAGGCCQD